MSAVDLKTVSTIAWEKRPISAIAIAAALILSGCGAPRIVASARESCSQVSSSIQPIHSDSSQFVDYELVWLGLKRVPYETEAIRYMLERRLTMLELTYDRQFWQRLMPPATKVPSPRAGIQPSPNPWGTQAGVFVRLTLQDAGHSSCTGFQRWANQYPGLQWPWMQKLGMRTDLCVGFELDNELKSRLRMYVEKSVIEPNGNNGALEVHKYRLHDHATKMDVGNAVLPIFTAYGHRDVLCGGDAVANQLKAAIQSTPDPRYASFSEISRESKPFPVASELSTDELIELGLNFKDRSISLDRKVWEESRYETKRENGVVSRISLVGYDLVSLSGDHLYRIPIRTEHAPRIQNPMAIGASTKSIAVLLRSGYKPSDGGVLLEFTRTGEPIREQLLTVEQIGSLQKISGGISRP